MKRVTLKTKARVGYDGSYAVIIPDHAAGRRGRYTVYLFTSHPVWTQWQAVKIIGRELPLTFARKVAAEAEVEI